MESLKKIKEIKSLINEFYHEMKCDNQLTNDSRECWLMYQNYCEEIEKDLERLEKLEAKDKKWQELFGCDLCEVLGRELLKEENKKLKQENKELLVNKNVAQGIATKYKKALDIIKNKKVDIDMFIDSTSAEDYNKRLEYYTYINPEVRPLTQEEYELLKEVLGYES